jgi:virginiamycin A acetyltransferase
MLKRLKQQFEKLQVRFLIGQEMESEKLRQIFRDRYDIEVGLYSLGCFDPWRIAPGTRIGRYSAISRSTRIIRSNHPFDGLTTHPYLYDPAFGVVEQNRIEAGHVSVGDDVWMGHNSLTTPGCTRIGRGAVVGAGAVVTRDVPPYAVVVGVPARIIRYRFEPDVIESIEASRWWEKSKSELKAFVRNNGEVVFHPTATGMAKAT